MSRAVIETPAPVQKAAAAASGPGQVLVTAEGVNLSFGKKRVLQNIDLSVRQGEIVTLIGPNGAGKTSLVRVLLGIQACDSGRVVRKRGLSTGYVPQRFQLDSVLPLSVRRFMNLPRRASEAELQAALDEVGAGYLLGHAMQTLSGGEFQRVMLARALLKRPDLLVLDEPLQGVDFSGQIALFDLINRLRRERGFGVIMVSHDLHLVMRGTDRVVCINHHLCCHGEPEAVSRNPAYLELFGPAAARSLAVYTHHHDHKHDVSGDIVPLESMLAEHRHAPGCQHETCKESACENEAARQAGTTDRKA